MLFLAWDVIYTSRAYLMMPVSVCLSVCLWRLCIVVTWCNGSRISLHAWIDGCIYYLLTTPHPSCWIVGWDDAGISGGRGGGYGKIGNCSDIAYFTYFFLSMDRKHVTYLFIWTILKFFFSNLGRKYIMSKDGMINYHIGPHRPKTAPHRTYTADV